MKKYLFIFGISLIASNINANEIVSDKKNNVYWSKNLNLKNSDGTLNEGPMKKCGLGKNAKMYTLTTEHGTGPGTSNNTYLFFECVEGKAGSESQYYASAEPSQDLVNKFKQLAKDDNIPNYDNLRWYNAN